jgi:hypothetical protein
VDELTRFAQRLVEQLGATGEGVHRPVEIATLRETVLPYRAHRRALGIETVEDYETVLLRLVAGERGYVKTMPAQAAERCREELAHSNPDLGVLDEVGAATIQITSMAAAQIVDGGGDGRTGGQPEKAVERPVGRVTEQVVEDKPRASVKVERPPKKPAQSAPPPEAIVSSELSMSSVSSAKSASPGGSCPQCQHAIPSGRQVVFCPWCGTRLIPFTCARCQTELDSRWKHCITCGAPVKDPFSYP